MAGTEFVTTIVFLGLLFGIGLPLLVVVLIARMVTQRRAEQRLSQDEEARFRQMWDSLGRMEDRIANLETILMSREKSKEQKG